jgi:hypothetical protein
LDYVQSLHLKNGILIVDSSEILPLPEWSAALVWLGAWCRKHQFIGKRLIAFVVLPTRELSAAFACVGNLLAGVEEFKDTLAWIKFSNLPKGSTVFWSPQNGRKHYEGKIMGLEVHGGSEFIVMQVIKAPRRSEVGSIRKISRMFFEKYRFAEEQPPTVSKTCAFQDAMQCMCGLLERVDPKWIWADGAEGMLITSMAKFEKAINGLSLKVDGQQAVSLRDLLCIGRNDMRVHAKIRISHPRGNLSGNFPLVILDGPDAFHIHEHLDNISNVLVILDRAEYQEGINDIVLQLKSIADNSIENYFDDIPDNFPPGIELAAYVIDRN